MERTIFYSWQSDLPNKTNRGFIESCLERAIKELSDEITPLTLELNIDRDTKSVIGTPDISDTIFQKISRSKLFVADISIINSESDDRKCPNPNVLIELGFAVRVLGWEKVFCFYNTDYGSIDDLPFDLRQRRPLQYSLDGKNKADERKRITKIVKNSILQLHRNGSLYSKIDDYFKEKVDTELLTIGGHLGKMIFGYQKKSTPELMQLLINLSDKEIEEKIKSKKLIGFQIYKNLNIHEQKLRKLADHAISSVHQNKELAVPIIEFISWTGRYDALTSPRRNKKLFSELNSIDDNYKVLPPESFQENKELPNRHCLIRKIDSEKGKVTDFGDFTYKNRVQKLTTHFEINEPQIDTFVSVVRDFISAINSWLDLTNGEFILDTYHNFEIKQN
ncbi:MAG: hypothetical protein WD512_12505 [Candidatus Paceibacterota bacterium]